MTLRNARVKVAPVTDSIVDFEHVRTVDTGVDPVWVRFRVMTVQERANLADSTGLVAEAQIHGLDNTVACSVGHVVVVVDEQLPAGWQRTWDVVAVFPGRRSQHVLLRHRET